jgi:hypothetical protein
MQKGTILTAAFFLLLGMGVRAQDMCKRAELKPVLSLEQMKQAELVDVLCTVTGLKESRKWPASAGKQTPEEYYNMEVKFLMSNGFPTMLQDLAPSALVNRRYFASLMFEIAMEADPQVQKDCKGANTETQRTDCLTQHEYLYNKELTVFRNEILTVLCDKRDILRKVIPPGILAPEAPNIYALILREGVLELPSTAEARGDVFRH